MRQALQTYTPRVLRLQYDALITDLGCQAVNGLDFYASQGFVRICVYDHDRNSGTFNASDKIAYAYGPLNTGDARPWATRWAAWVASAGIRVGRYPLVTLPSNGLGSPSNLFPTTTPNKLALGFTSKSQMGIAIQKTEGTIQIKWFKSSQGEVGDVTFDGFSPVMFGNGLVYNSPSATDNDLVLYYLKASSPRSLFARFERDNFGVEKIINTDLPVPLKRLLSSEKVGDTQELYALDSLGRDVTLYSRSYSAQAIGDKASLSTFLQRGDYRQSAIIASFTGDKGTLSANFDSGSYNQVIIEVTGENELSNDAGMITVGLESGSYE